MLQFEIESGMFWGLCKWQAGNHFHRLIDIPGRNAPDPKAVKFGTQARCQIIILDVFFPWFVSPIAFFVTSGRTHTLVHRLFP
jgi:hypothetical protein